MSYSKDDSRLLSYVLGELDADEAKALEAAIVANPELRAEVDELRELGALLREGLEKKTPAMLTDAQREAITKEAEKKTLSNKVPRKRSLGNVGIFAAVAAMAAGAALFVSYPLEQRRSHENASERAVTDQQLRELKAQEEGARQKQEALLAELGSAKDDATRARVQAQLENDLSNPKKAKGGGGKLGNFAAEPALPEANTESFAAVEENPFVTVSTDPRSTFSIDVDTASYALVRRFLEAGQKPPKGAVRIEELINYFPYDDPRPQGDMPFAVSTEIASAPWAPGHRLVRIALKGKAIDRASRPGTNLVFLVDVSGSMDAQNKLPLLKRAFSMLINELDARDKISIVVYAGASGLVLPPTSGADKQTLLAALDKLSAGGSTNGGQGIELAYAQAQRSFVEGGENRVILATDGDFNVGTTDRGSLVDLIKNKAKTGVYLSVLGFGMGNYKDDSLELLAKHGNGNYAYIDTIKEAQKVLVEQMTGTLVTIAKDVKIQVEWNPLFARSFRLIGYENRMLAHRDFNDDTKDAGDIGAGHSVTALYEVIPAGSTEKEPSTDPLKYQKPNELSIAAQSRELVTIKLRFKRPENTESEKIEVVGVDSGKSFQDARTEFRFSAAVAELGLVLRDSPHKGSANVAEVVALAETSLGEDPGGHRRDFVALAKRATNLREATEETLPAPHRHAKCDPADPLCSDL